MAKQCELCRKNFVADMRFGVGMCKPCMDHFQKAVLGDIDELNYFISPDSFPEATPEAEQKIIKFFAKKYEKMTSAENLTNLEEEKKAEAERLRAEAAERNKKLREDRLNSLRYRGYEGYYEYKTVVINDNSDGGVWADTISSTLNNLALDGWRLVSSYTNELGHNSKPGSVLSAGTNATIDEHIFILERFIKL